MITIQNYNDKKSNINWKDLPEAVTKNRKAVEEMFDLYGEDEDIDKMINTFLGKVNEGYKQATATGKTKSAAKTKPTPKKKLPVERVQGGWNYPEKNETIADVVKGSKLFKLYAPKPQQAIVLQSDEHIDTIKKLEKDLAAIPTKEQGGKIMDQKIYAHYFYGGSDWYVMDRSRGDREPFGYAILNGDLQMAEAGYLPLAEFQTSKKVELDFFFNQGQTLKSVLKKQYPSEFAEEVKKIAPKKAAPAKKSVKKAVNVTTVDSYSEEFKLLRRFLNATKKENLSFRQVHLLWMAFNKAAVSRKVRKSSDKADEFTEAQKGIEKIFGQVEFSERAKKNGVKLNIENEKLIKNLQKYISSTKINYAVTLLRSFIGFQGTQPGIDKANRLLKKINNAFAKDRIDKTNRLYDELMRAKEELRDYIKTPANDVEVDMIGLSAPRDLCTNRIKCEGLNSKGQLNDGYRFLKGGAVVKTKKKSKTAKPLKKRIKKKGLKQPEIVVQREQEFVEPTQDKIIEPIEKPEPVEVQSAAKPQTKNPAPKKRSTGRGKNLSEAMANSSENVVFTTGGNIGKFLGKLEKKPVHSVVTTLDAEQGAGKTRFFFQVINEVANTGARVLFYSLEEHPQSKLFKDKISQYIDPSNYENITVIDEVVDWNKEKATINEHDHIFVDSFQKLPPIDLDKDIRKAFNGKFFYLIYQQTGTKAMRGGSKAAFDGDIILKIEKGKDYRDHFVYANKNRYNDAPGLKFNICNRSLVQAPGSEWETEQHANSRISPNAVVRLIATPIF